VAECLRASRLHPAVSRRANTCAIRTRTRCGELRVALKRTTRTVRPVAVDLDDHALWPPDEVRDDATAADIKDRVREAAPTDEGLHQLLGARARDL
jgi:hypothetical protein